jgi:hypothetical protein
VNFQVFHFPATWGFSNIFEMIEKNAILLALELLLEWQRLLRLQLAVFYSVWKKVQVFGINHSLGVWFLLL